MSNKLVISHIELTLETNNNEFIEVRLNPFGNSIKFLDPDGREIEPSMWTDYPDLEKIWKFLHKRVDWNDPARVKR